MGHEKMNCKYDTNEKTLYINRYIIPAYKFEKNEIGSCSSCNSELSSISYHIYKDCYLIVTGCISCDNLYLNIFDNSWDWQSEILIDQVNNKPVDKTDNINSQNIETNEESEMLDNIPVKQLETIFSPTEIDAMFAKARGDKYVRQYLYRARKKYQDFEDVFGIKLYI